MVAVLPPRPIAETDDRQGFDCGSESLNGWFRRHALRNHMGGASRVNVLEDAASGRIVGFVALSAAQIERDFMAKASQRNQPDPIPVTLLGQLAVDRAYQGQGHAASLLIFALRSSLGAAALVGSLGVVTHPVDDAVRSFYAKWSFAELPYDPDRAMMARMSDIQRSFGP
jgi:GNAT superfamily N-acetyltransferase